MAELLFPVGQFGGNDADAYPVRAGDQVYPLTSDEFATWVYTHGLPGNTESWTEAALTAVLAEAGVVHFAAALEVLRGSGLIIAVDPAQGQDFASRHTLSPLLLGLGEVAEPIDGYCLGMIESPVTTVAGPMFALWAWCAVETDLWSACTRLAHDAAESGGAEPAFTDSSLVLQGLLGGLHGLLATNAAYLDRVPA